MIELRAITAIIARSGIIQGVIGAGEGVIPKSRPDGDDSVVSVNRQNAGSRRVGAATGYCCARGLSHSSHPSRPERVETEEDYW